MTLTKIGASLGGAADTLLVTQTGHGFVSNDVGKAVKMLSTGLYDLAKADAITNADSVGIILQRIDANTLLLALSGRVTVDACVPTGNPGTVLFLPTASIKNTTTGYLTATEPSSASEVSKPMAVITISGSEMILFQMRGEVISSGATTIVDDSVTNAKLADMATRTVKANATSGSANPTDVVMADGDFLIANASGLVTVPIAGDVDVSNTGAATLTPAAITGKTAKSSVAGADTILISDSAASGALKEMTRTNFVAGIGGGPTEAVQSDMEDEGGSNANRYASPEVMKYHHGVAKAWIKWSTSGSSSGSIVGHHGWSSISYGGATGDSDHTMGVTFNSIDTQVFTAVTDDARIVCIGTSSTTTVTTRIYVVSSSGLAGSDVGRNMMAVFGVLA